MLGELFKKKSASLVVIRGRRRIGKSRLAQEFAQKTPHYVFSGLPPTSGISAADQREEFARQIQREMKTPLPRAEVWDYKPVSEKTLLSLLDKAASNQKK